MGKVVCSESGEPGRFAQVRLISQAFEFNGVGRVVSGAADVNGDFVIPNVPKGRYFADASLQGYFGPERGRDLEAIAAMTSAAVRAETSGRVAVEVTGGSEQRITIPLSKGGIVLGTVTFKDKAPAIGAKVEALLLTAHPNQLNEVIAQAQPAYTDDQGHYRIAGIPPGRWILQVSLPEGRAGVDIYPTFSGNTIVQSEALSFTTTSMAPRTIDLSVSPKEAHQISGVLLHADSRPGPNEVVLLRDISGRLPMLSTLTDDTGHFKFPMIVPGKFEVVSGNRRSEAGTPISVGREDINNITITK